MKKIQNILIAGLIIILVSCSKDQLNENPPNFTTADALYETVEGFEAGINGLYSLVRDERNGLNYTSGFGTIDLAATLSIAGTDNVASGSNTGGLSTIIADWKKNTPTDPNLNKLFLWLYQTVGAANTIISRADNPSVNWGAPENKARIIAEARTIRAWAYRHLTYLWGDVPLLTEEVSGDNLKQDFNREKVTNIRRVMIEDWKFAAENLPLTPYKAGRLTRGVAQTYLAETYLAIGKPDSALIWADKCISAGPYSLVKNRYGVGANKPGIAFMDMFNPANTNISNGNTEALCVMQWERNATGGGENLMRHETTLRYERAKYSKVSGFVASTEERGGRGWSRQTITKKALLLYNSSSDKSKNKIDQRGSEFALRKFFILGADDDFVGVKNTATNKNWASGDTVWLATPISKGSIPDPGKKNLSGAIDFNLLPEGTENNNDWPYSLKFAFSDPGFPTTTESHQDQIYMRLAETILLQAEARGRLGNFSGAATSINLLRDRANAKQVTVADFGSGLTSFLDFILDERSRELLLEEHRRYTLLRMGGVDYFFRRVKAFNTIDQNLSLRDTLFPIPQTVIDANLNIKMPQNPGF